MYATAWNGAGRQSRVSKIGDVFICGWFFLVLHPNGRLRRAADAEELSDPGSALGKQSL